MIENHVKAKLAAGDFAFGGWISFTRNPALIRVIAAAGYDFVLIDMEHSSLSIEVVSDMCEMARGLGLVPLVRPYSRDSGVGSRLLDVGAMGLMHFGVNTRQEVREFMDWMRFPPDGSRGQTGGAAFDYQTSPSLEANQFVNDNIMLVIQIETKEAVERIDEILEGGGVDVVELGRSDLSKSYGVPGQRRHEMVLGAVDKVAAACKRRRVSLGLAPDSAEDAEDLVKRGARCLFHPRDLEILTRAYREGNAMLRAAAERAR